MKDPFEQQIQSTMETVTAVLQGFTQDRSFKRLAYFLEKLLIGYVEVLSVEKACIMIFHKLGDSILLLSGAYTDQMIQNEAEQYFAQNGKGSAFQRVLEHLIQFHELHAEKISSDFECLGIPLQDGEDFIGAICLWGPPGIEKKCKTSYMLILEQLCVSLVIGYYSEQKNKEALNLMRIKDEMLDIYLRQLEKKNDELIHAKEMADSANKDKNVLMGYLGHEFRTPLTTIMGASDLLFHTELEAKQMRYVKMIYNSAELFLNYINDFLDLSKIESGNLRIENISLNLPLILRDIIELFIIKIPKKVDFLLYYDPKLPMWVQGDLLRLRQIMINILGNAFKFTERGYVFLSVTSRASNILFEISDTGIGIPENEREKIFKKYSQIGPTAHRFGGTGLGLALCKQLVEMMDGSIGYKSSEKGGATFWFKIPLEETLPKLPDEQVDKYDVLHGKTLMLLSYQPLLKKILSNYLRHEEMDVQICKNIEEVLDLLPFHFMLIDVGVFFNNHVIDSEVWEKVKKVLEEQEIKTIFLGEPEEVNRISTEGLSYSVMPKQFMRNDLLELL